MPFRFFKAKNVKKISIEFKKETVQLAENIEISQACRRLEICENNPQRWKKKKKIHTLERV